MGDIIAALPSLGPYAIFIVLLVYMGRLLLTADNRHAKELARINEDHDEELRELRSDIVQLREDVRDLQYRLELETELRREAEESLHRFRLRSAEGGEP